MVRVVLLKCIVLDSGVSIISATAFNLTEVRLNNRNTQIVKALHIYYYKKYYRTHFHHVHRCKEKLLLVADDLWRYSLLKYYKYQGKHSSALTSHHGPVHTLWVD